MIEVEVVVVMIALRVVAELVLAAWMVWYGVMAIFFCLSGGGGRRGSTRWL